jgi:filamentous hemagglutinin family protein
MLVFCGWLGVLRKKLTGVLTIFVIVFHSQGVQAQVITDDSLNTTVSGNDNHFIITNGTAAGANLFHSFRQFSIPAHGAAIFDLSNTSNITTIFSRVTGGNISQIDGLIKTINSNHPVSIFLLNPKGIVFGANSKLDIGGSFIGTTATGIQFADGMEFPARTSPIRPLLSMKVPTGLQMGSNSAPISVTGTGHALTSPAIGLVTRKTSPTELRVKPGNTLALVGGGISLQGATLTAETGRIELGSTSDAGIVQLIPNSAGYELAYENGQSFGDINLKERSLLDISGNHAGSIQVQGRQIQFTDGSIILAQNFGSVKGGDIRVKSTQAIDLIGTTANGQIRSGLKSEAGHTGASGNVYLTTPRLTLQQGAGVNTLTTGSADGGNIYIDAKDMEISGFASINPIGVTTLTTSTRGSGNAGDIFVNADNLLVAQGASLSSVTFGTASSGELRILTQSTTITGENPFGLYSNIASTTFGTGNAKILTLDTGKLQILDGGAVGATAFFRGNGGDLKINASDSITISGRSRLNQSSINSSSSRLSAQLRQQFGLPDILTANAGNVTITTPNLMLTNSGSVSVTSQGSGDGGNIKITAGNIQLNQQGIIQAQTESGEGGNIALDASNILQMGDNSFITSTAGGSGNGGNITINAPIIAGFGNSDIIANAVQGRGGNIQITTEGIVGLEFRSQQTQESDITASSQFGVSGTVQINNIGVDPNSGLVELPTKLTDSSKLIATGCAGEQKGRFVATGRGGIPKNPLEEIVSDNRIWSDTRDISSHGTTAKLSAQTIPPISTTLIEATSWHRNADGKVELIAKSPTPVQPQLTCASVVMNK